MIHTPRRVPAPAALVRWRERWTARWMEMHQRRPEGSWATKAAKRELKPALLAMTHGKCSYCEGRLESQSYCEIEHYHAKTVRADLSFEWSNLFPSCTICNVEKSAEDHQGELVKSDTENPEEFFWLDPDSGELQPHPTLDDGQRRRAERTINLCDLQRGAL